jgi:flagellar hook protein FlgE
MGIFDALNTSVSGLQAQSFALQNISGNIANASTVGFKGTDTSFEDLVQQATTPDLQAAGGVAAHAQATITTQGTISATTVATNVAISGDGFFNVQKPIGVVDNVPVFNGVTDYTRRGDFQLNANGNLVNGAGYFLLGVNVDPKTGNPVGNVPKVLQFQNNFIPAQATTKITYAANLPTKPSTVASSTANAGSLVADGGLNPADFSAAANPLILGTPAAPFTNSSVSGSGVNNKLGNPITNATLLSGGAGSDSITTNFVAGDTIVIDNAAATKTITFTNSGGSGPTAGGFNIDLSTSPNVGTLLGAIDTLNGNPAPGAPPSTVSGGAITLNSGTASNLTVASSSTAFGALGLISPVTVTRGGGGGPGAGIVIGSDATAFANESISGGAVTAFDATGTPVNLQLRWAKTDSASLGAPHTDTWNLFYQSNPNATGGQTEWTNTGTNFVFGPNGTLVSPSGSSITLPNVSVGNQTLGNLTFSFGAGGLTQFASSGGTSTINQIQQDGFSAGQLLSVAVSNTGLVVGTFSNGQNLDLAAISLSHFNGANQLKPLDGGAYAATDQSGVAIAGATGQIAGSSVEGSNTDIADQFTKLIVTQQVYSANTKVITTADTIIQDLLNVLR